MPALDRRADSLKDASRLQPAGMARRSEGPPGFFILSLAESGQLGTRGTPNNQRKGWNVLQRIAGFDVARLETVSGRVVLFIFFRKENVYAATYFPSAEMARDWLGNHAEATAIDSHRFWANAIEQPVKRRNKVQPRKSDGSRCFTVGPNGGRVFI